jgi:tetratricopeptide (TPR) repeat protein
MLPARDPTLEPAVDRVLGLILTREGRAPHASLPKRLTALFRELRETATPAVAEEIQDLIWAHWCDHDEAAANELMQEGIAAMAAEEFEQARSLFDALVGATPDWAEAWNKRATVSFILGDDADSLADIVRVLEREPRHFGALSGFGQIALRNGFVHEAIVAFEAAIAINPHLRGVGALIADLKRDRARVLN